MIEKEIVVETEKGKGFQGGTEEGEEGRISPDEFYNWATHPSDA